MAEKKRRQGRRAHGEGTLFHRKDGRWQASFITKDGKRLYFYGKTKVEALEKLQKAQDEGRRGTLATGPRQKLADFLLEWLEKTHKPPLVRHRTYVQYRSAIHNHLIPGL